MDISKVFLACEISRGAFSAERVFGLQTYSGRTYVSVSPVYYCFKEDLTPLERDEPSNHNRLQGCIEGRVVSNGRDKARVAIPDGATVEVHTGIFRKKA